MFNKIYKAFYLSLFIAAIRKIVFKTVISPAAVPNYAIVIPFSNHGIIAGKYHAKRMAIKASDELERQSGFKCFLVRMSDLDGYISRHCSGNSSSIFDNGMTREYLSGVMLGLCRGIVKAYEGTL